MTVLKISDARNHLSDLADEVAFKGKRISVYRNGKPAFGMVSVEDLELLENFKKMVAVAITRKALKKGKFISIKEIDKRVGR